MKNKTPALTLKAQQLLRKRIKASYPGGSYELEMAEVFSTFIFDNQPDWFAEVDEMRLYLQEITFLLGTRQGCNLVKELKLGIDLDEHSCVRFKFMQLEGFLRELQNRLEDTMELFSTINTDLDAKWLKNRISDLKKAKVSSVQK